MGGSTGDGDGDTGDGDGAQPPEREIVFTWGEEGNERAFDAGDWFVDSAEGAQSGETAVHPSWLEAGGDDVSMTFDCDDQTHTQLSFWLVQQRGGSNSNSNGIPIEQLGLHLAVDGVDRESFGGVYSLRDGQWVQYTFDVPQGKHEYTFTVHSDDEIAPPFVLDSFICQ
jgi:hypothetical protein